MADVITYREAVADGIAREMRTDPTVVCLGEDIGAAEVVAAASQAAQAAPAADPAEAFTDVWADGGWAWRT